MKMDYPTFVKTDDQRKLYEACLQELTVTGTSHMDIPTAEFVIEQHWPTLLGQLHLMERQKREDNATKI